MCVRAVGSFLNCSVSVSIDSIYARDHCAFDSQAVGPVGQYFVSRGQRPARTRRPTCTQWHIYGMHAGFLPSVFTIGCRQLSILRESQMKAHSEFTCGPNCLAVNGLGPEVTEYASFTYVLRLTPIAQRRCFMFPLCGPLKYGVSTVLV